jgi:hypothetical protein
MKQAEDNHAVVLDPEVDRIRKPPEQTPEEVLMHPLMQVLYT